MYIYIHIHIFIWFILAFASDWRNSMKLPPPCWERKNSKQSGWSGDPLLEIFPHAFPGTCPSVGLPMPGLQSWARGSIGASNHTSPYMTWSRKKNLSDHIRFLAVCISSFWMFIMLLVWKDQCQFRVHRTLSLLKVQKVQHACGEACPKNAKRTYIQESIRDPVA